MPYGYLSFKMSSRLRDSLLCPKVILAVLVKTPWLWQWFPFSDNTTISFYMVFKTSCSVAGSPRGEHRFSWRREPLLQAHSWPVSVWHHLCPCPLAPASFSSPAHSGMLSEPVPLLAPFFRSLFGVFTTISQAALQKK